MRAPEFCPSRSPDVQDGRYRTKRALVASGNPRKMGNARLPKGHDSQKGIGQPAVNIDATQLAMLLDGINVVNDVAV